MTQRHRSRRFLENVGWTLIRQAATLLISFFLTPILVRGLGKEGYGLYSLIGILLGLLSTLALGGSSASVRFASEAAAADDPRRLRDTFRHALVMHTVVPCAGALALAFAAGYAPGLLSLPPELAGPSVRLFRWVALGSAFFVAGQAALCMLTSLDRFSTSSLIETTLAFALLGGSALLAHLGFGIGGIGPWFAAANAAAAAWGLTAAANTVRSRTRHAGARNSPLSLREFVTASFPYFLSHILWMCNFQMDKMFIAALRPLSTLTYYVIPFSVAQRLESIPRSISYAAFQMAGELSGAQHAQSVRRLYLKSTKLIGLALAPPVVLLFAFAPQFLTLWLGSEFSDYGTWPFRIILAGFCFNFLAMSGSSVTQGVGRPFYAVYSLAGSAVCAFVIWGLFIPRYGVIAAAGGFLVGQAVAAAILLHFFHRDVLKLSFGDFLSESLRAPAISAAVLLVLSLFLHPAADTWLKLTASIAAGLALSFGLSLLLLDPDEKDLLRQFLQRKTSFPETSEETL